MNNDIIHKLEDIAIKMNNQHDRLERLIFGVELNLITCNKIEPEKNNIHKTISLNKTGYWYEVIETYWFNFNRVPRTPAPVLTTCFCLTLLLPLQPE